MTSFGTIEYRNVIIVEAWDEENRRGFGEASPISPPLYTEESAGTAWHVLQEYLGPLALRSSWESPGALSDGLSVIRRNYAAKSGLEGALWDLFAQRASRSIAKVLGGVRPQVESGIVLGIPQDQRELFERVEAALLAGYRRIKVKVKPGWDVEPIRLLRRHFGDIPLSVDANSAYTLEDAEHLRSLDEFGLDMIEQPLAWDDLVDHAKLQRRLETPICLDESVTSVETARHALELGSCRIVNVKIGRVGGHTAAVRIHDLCRAHGVPVWCGGLLETGIGRAHSLALASLSNFSLPADLSPSRRYFTHDLIEPPITFATPGCIEVPQADGIGVNVSDERLAFYTVRTSVLTRDSHDF